MKKILFAAVIGVSAWACGAPVVQATPPDPYREMYRGNVQVSETYADTLIKYCDTRSGTVLYYDYQRGSVTVSPNEKCNGR